MLQFGLFSHSLDRDVVRVCSEPVEIVGVRSNHGSAGLGERDHDCIDGRASMSSPAEKRSPPRQPFRDLLHDVASLQEAVRERIAAGMSLQAVDEND